MQELVVARHHCRRTAAGASLKVGLVSVVPGGGAHREPAIADEARGQERDEREEAEQDWRSASNGEITPLPLRLDAEMSASFF